MSIGEVQDVMWSRSQARRREAKERIMTCFELAALIGTHISRLFDDKNQVTIPTPWDVYPDLFADEKAVYEEQQQSEQALAELKSRRKEYAAWYNKNRKSTELGGEAHG
ncbi:hypothetical protein [Hominifimenecus sp. rT4P-3]|uniref:hypothetical protein n=1 Tax=Hominifimenecus sp. rT4P-3 TaxID=3242979 RepID=UPI003DA3F7B1